MKRWIVNAIKYGCGIAFVVAVGSYYLLSHDFQAAALLDRYRMMSDAFALPGYMLILVAGLIWVTNQGALDGVSYCLKMAVAGLIPGKRDSAMKYGDYVEEKREKRMKGYSFLLFTGLGSVLLSLVFLILYYRA